jgi:acyl carrier protein
MPAYDTILAGLVELLQSYNETARPIAEDTDLVEELGLTSLTIMELLMEIEDRFDISVPLNILPDVRTVRDLALQLEKLTGQVR